MKIILTFVFIIAFGVSLYADKVNVSIIGEVVKPGQYSLEKGSTIYDLIIVSGGYKDRAYLRGGKFYRKLINIKEKDISKEVEMRFCKSYPFSNSDDLIRIPIELKYPRLFKNSTSDIVLEDGDVLEIPTKTDIVYIFGLVLKPGALKFEKDFDVEDYIAAAGGVVPGKNIFKYVYKVDGNVKVINDGFIVWNEFKNRWEFGLFSKDKITIEPGDTIVVYEYGKK